MKPRTQRQLFSGIGMIRTKRLVIRPFGSNDMQAWCEGYLARKPSQNRHDPGAVSPERTSSAAFRRWLKSKDELRRRDLQYVYGIFDRKTGACLGIVDFVVYFRLALQVANLGYQIHNQHWGKGYAKEAVAAAVKIAFRDLKLHRLEAGIERDNFASVAIAKAADMKYEGLRKKYIFVDGKWKDIEIYYLHSEDLGIRIRPEVRTKIGQYWKMEGFDV